MNESDKKLLLEQYKLYVESAEKVSIKRHNSNLFYTSLLSALITLMSFISDGFFTPFLYDLIIYLSISFLGLLISFVWYFNIRSYKQLNKGKFEVITRLENHLPYPCFSEEWKILGKGKDKEKYRKITDIEEKVPLIFLLLFFILLLYFGGYLLFKFI